MADNSPTAVYNGQGLTVAGWQARGERNAEPDDNDMTAGQAEANPHLGGQTPTAAGSPCGAEVPNLRVEHVSRPAQTHGLPSNLQTNPLSSGRSRNR